MFMYQVTLNLKHSALLYLMLVWLCRNKEIYCFRDAKLINDSLYLRPLTAVQLNLHFSIFIHLAENTTIRIPRMVRRN